MADTINKRIKHYRNERGLTQGELAAKLGIKTSTYSQMEREGNISVEMALKIAAALKIDPVLLIFEEQNNGLDISPVKPEPIVFHSPKGFIDEIYGEPTDTQPITDEANESQNDLPFVMTNTEKSVIKTYHYLSKPKQKEVRQFIDVVRKRGN